MSPSLAGGLAVLVALFGTAVRVSVQAGAIGDGRAESGARLFRAMLAADTDIERKVDASGALRILIVHTGDSNRAADLGTLVEGGDSRASSAAIKGLSVRTETLRIDQLPRAEKIPVAGAFVAEPLGRQGLAVLIHFGMERHIIVYSAFEGDVENGASGGLSIEAQVRPFVNVSALRNAGITLRGFFLRVAKVYP